MTDGKGQHYFRPKLCTPGRQKQKEPSQMAEPPKKVQEGSAAKGTRPDGAASHPLDGTEAHASNPADSTLPPETGSQQSLFSLWDAYPTLSSVSQDPNGVPRFGGLFACSDDPLSIYYQCPASDDPNAPQQYLYTGHFSGDPNTFYGQPECGPSTSCPPNGPPWQKRHESKRDVGDSGSVCALQARGDRAQRPAPFV
ncbi:hypothetical protein BCR37DRAFT_384147 [Protomyces lactucae-debilis]|uniref:Uncharacterized protein n=1 Tax=Protomyces lactucae-debilis TaxID=2754530 RepID=A0A1Y2EVC6_PROLT|nr:uncharacterized protein BCR37DRAFT_384147 [Protomyces lactucae-debilis]ORY75096.1 hypothetical protein BCR37DRAFT_384147 [Protomyces lactucae-debilis]